MEYDDASRVISDSLTVNLGLDSETTLVTSNEYDPANRLIKQTYPDYSVVDRSYDNRNLLEEIDWHGQNVHSRRCDDGMRLTEFTHGNSLVSTLSYRDGDLRDNLLRSIDTPAGPTASSTVGNYSYAYDPNKNKTQEAITGVLQGFGFGEGTGATTVYDADDRLTTWGAK